MALHLVTGGAGFIGSSIAEKLLSSGERVRVLDDFSSGRCENLEGLPGHLEVVEGSVVDPATVARAMAGVETVFHEAAIPSVVRSVENPQASMLAGAQGTTIVLDQARHKKVRRVVFAASSSAPQRYPDVAEDRDHGGRTRSRRMPRASWRARHLMGTYSVYLHGIETLSLRYFNVFGPRQDPKSDYAAVIPKFITAAIRKQPAIVYGDGEQTRDFCHIDNAVRANLLAATTPRKLRGEIVNVACGERTSLNQLVRNIAELAGTRIEPDYRPGRAGDVRDSLADIGVARDLLGYEPTVDVREGLKRTFEAFQRFTR